MKQARRLVAVVALLAGAGCAGTPIMAPPSVNVTGKWLGAWMFDPVSLGGGQVVMDLKQVGRGDGEPARHRAFHQPAHHH
jgi:hypothetical protein